MHPVSSIMRDSFMNKWGLIIKAAGITSVLLIVWLDPLYEGIVLFTMLSMLMTALLFLIKDMDNPFEVGAGSHADVDLFLPWDLEKELREKIGPAEKKSPAPRALS